MPEISINVPAGGASVTAAFAGGRQIPIFTNVGLTTQAPLPIALSATSRTTLYIGAVGSYDITVTDASGRVLEVADGIAMSVEPLVFVPAGSVSIADGSATYVPSGSRNRRQREIDPLWVSTPQALAPASDIPTFATSGPGGPSGISGAVAIPYNDPAFVGLGTVDTLNTALGTNYWQNTCSGNTGGGATPHGRTFDYYGRDLAIVFRNAVSGGSRFWVFVDGLPCTSVPQASSAATPNSQFYYRLTWGTARLRRITVYLEWADWGGIQCGPTDTVLPGPKPGLSIFGIGDSYMAGANASSALQSYGFQVARMLGAEFYCGSWAGTGYSSGASTYGSALRIGKIPPGVDWVWFVGSINDGAIASATVQAAATAAYSAAAAQAPTARLLVTSVQANSGSMSAGDIANGAAVAAAATAAGAIVVSQPIAEGWITGTGRVGAPSGSGNADVFVGTDGIHPSQAGQDYFARRSLAAMRAALPA